MPRIYCHIQRNPTENGQTERDAGPRVCPSNSYIAIASCLTIDNDADDSENDVPSRETYAEPGQVEGSI